MARKPKNEAVDEQLDSTDTSIDGNNARSFRLNDEQRAEILRMNAEGKRKAEIAEAIGTTVATVGRTINAASGGGASASARLNSMIEPQARVQSDTQRRLIAFAAAILLGEPVDDAERAALTEILKERVAEARQRAVMEALLRI